MTITAADVNWIAGFLDGEGWFGFSQRRIGVTVVQKDDWPLLKLQAMIGGKIRLVNSHRSKNGINFKYWRWEAHGALAAGVMMTVYSLISPRRQQRIRNTLDFYKSIGRRGKHYGQMTHCTHGHEYTPENTLQKKNGRQCRECMKGYQVTYQAKKKAPAYDI